MTIQWISGDTFTCVSGDTKPTLVPTDTKAIETNTDDVYRFNGTSWVLFSANDKTETLTNKTISGAANTLSSIPVNSLTNFAVASPTADQIMQYNGTNWVNATSPATGLSGAEFYIIYKDASDANKVKSKNTRTGAIVATHATDIGNVLDTTEALMTAGGTIKILHSSTVYDFNTQVSITNNKVCIQSEYGTIIKPVSGFATNLFTIEAENFGIVNNYIDCSNMGNGTGSGLMWGHGAVQKDWGYCLNNTFINVPTHGIWIGIRTNAVVVAGNRVQSTFGPTGNGIIVSSCSDHRIVYNDVGGYGAGSGIASSGAGANIIANNEVYNNLRGILVYDSNDTIVSNNLVNDESTHGILISNDTATNYKSIVITGNRIENCGYLTTNSYDGIAFSIASTGVYDGVIVSGNVCTNDTAGASRTQRYGININTNKVINAVIAGNSCPNNVTGPINRGTLHSSCYVYANPPEVSHNVGTATIVSGQTTIPVSHGLSYTPTLSQIQVTPTNNPTAVARHWISTPNSTQFTINVNADPGATTATFVWVAGHQAY